MFFLVAHDLAISELGACVCVTVVYKRSHWMGQLSRMICVKRPNKNRGCVCALSDENGVFVYMCAIEVAKKILFTMQFMYIRVVRCLYCLFLFNWFGCATLAHCILITTSPSNRKRDQIITATTSASPEISHTLRIAYALISELVHCLTIKSTQQNDNELYI